MTTTKVKVPYIYSISDYDRNPDVYKKGDYDPFDKTLPKFITGPKEPDIEPEWWRRKNEQHEANGRCGYRTYYFKSLIKSRKHGNYMKGFRSVGRSYNDAKQGLLIAMGWDKDESKVLIDITFDQYKRLKK